MPWISSSLEWSSLSVISVYLDLKISRFIVLVSCIFLFLYFSHLLLCPLRCQFHHFLSAPFTSDGLIVMNVYTSYYSLYSFFPYSCIKIRRVVVSDFTDHNVFNNPLFNPCQQHISAVIFRFMFEASGQYQSDQSHVAILNW